MDRFAVISDIHGNLHALEAVLAEIDRLAINEVVCLGDIVGYGPFPHKCVDLVIRCCSIIVRGNHEEAVVDIVGDETTFGQVRDPAIEATDQLRHRVAVPGNDSNGTDGQ